MFGHAPMASLKKGMAGDGRKTLPGLQGDWELGGWAAPAADIGTSAERSGPDGGGRRRLGAWRRGIREVGLALIILGVIILLPSWLFVPIHVAHPVWMVAFLVLTAVTFSLLGFIIGIVADGFERLQVVPLLVITPLTFLGGSFYSISVLPPLWQTIALFNPIVYLVSGFRWSFFEVADVNVGWSVAATAAFLLACLAVVSWIFSTGYRIKT